MGKNKPIEPYINCDGWYAQCPKCWMEINPEYSKCPKCNQSIDWTWLNKKEEFQNEKY